MFIDLERDCIGSALKYLGYSSNTSDQKQIAAAKDAIIKIKPHLQAFLNTNVGKGLSTARPRSRWTGTTTSRC